MDQLQSFFIVSEVGESFKLSSSFVCIQLHPTQTHRSLLTLVFVSFLFPLEDLREGSGTTESEETEEED
ncbi:hypothetical protein F7725_008547, partial [Dissostichus mawsoni]